MTATLFDRRQMVRRRVELFRNTSKRLRQLKQGGAVNPSLRLIHANYMQQICTELRALGYRKVARLLSQWHSYLMSARKAEDEKARKELLCLAREVSRNIGRAIEEIR